MAIAGLTPADVRANVSGVGSLSDERLDVITEVAAALIERYARAAPVPVKCEAGMRFIGYLVGTRNTGGPRRVDISGKLSIETISNHSAMFRNCGAAALLAPWRTRRAGVV